MNSKIFLTAAALGLSTPGFAADLDNGGKLHMDNCIRCHDSNVYTRANRRVNDLPSLGKQVRFCRDNLGVTWFDDEVADVIHYLNTSYYKF